jgi:membrane-bound lytic murein transglycosylase D
MATSPRLPVPLALFILALLAGSTAPAAAEPGAKWSAPPSAPDAAWLAALPPEPEPAWVGDGVAPPPDLADLVAEMPDLGGEPVGRGEPDGRGERDGDDVGFPRLPSPTPSLNARVMYYLDRFTGSRREVVSIWVTRSTRYLMRIREMLRDHGLPEELVWVAMIESGFNPRAKSRAGAKGLWQFMPATARRYGLRVDKWVDERVDPERSTVAAAGYLRDLYGLFGSWPLAWAAYNAGEVTVSRAIRQAGSNDFWTLARTKHLRRETKDFVPQIEAATLLAREPERYGFEFDPTEPAAVEPVSVPPSTDLGQLSAATGLSLAVLRDLNPALVRGATPPGAPWLLRVPEGSRHVVEAALVAKTVRARPDVHVVQPRDTIGSIAKRYRVSVDDVLRWNRFDARRVIRPGDRVRVAEVETQGQGGFR